MFQKTKKFYALNVFTNKMLNTEELNQPITLSEGKKSIKLPLINLIRLTMVYFKGYIQEYQKIDPNIKKFWDWMLHEKLKVPKGGAILK